MPWKECNKMEERLRFVARRLDGEKMAVMCRTMCIEKENLDSHLLHAIICTIFNQTIDEIEVRLR
ncbi:MAG: hypothetical protein GQ538_01705 [Xanthomonadales bacterium]|nr:hypothetical protein [Xanthomonadales bacterium]